MKKLFLMACASFALLAGSATAQNKPGYIDTTNIHALGKGFPDQINRTNKRIADLKMQIEQLSMKVAKDSLKVDEDQLGDLQDELHRLNRQLKKTALLSRELSGDTTATAALDSMRGKRFVMDREGLRFESEPKRGHKTPQIRSHKFQMFGLDLGVNSYNFSPGYQNLSNEQQSNLALNPLKSVDVTLHVLREAVNLYQDKLYFTYGLAVDYHDFRFEHNVTLLPHTDSFKMVKADFPLKKSKLSVQYLNVPVMLHFETKPLKPSRSFHIGVGGYAGIRIKSYTKQVSDQNGKQHIYEDFNLNSYDYGVSALLGYGDIQFYTNYSLSPLFNKTSGAPELMPITAGIIVRGLRWGND